MHKGDENRTTVAAWGGGARRFVVALAVVVGLGAMAGCGVVGKKRPAEPDRLVVGDERVEITEIAPFTITQQVKIQTVTQDRYVQVHGPNIESSFQPLDWGDGTYYRNTSPKYGGFPRHFLRSWQDRATGQVQHELYVAYAYSAANPWRFQTVQFDNAAVAPIRLLKMQEVECFSERCVRVEHLSVPLSDGYLRSRFYSGFYLHILTPEGHSAMIKVPANYVQGYMTAVDRIVWRR